MTSSKEVCAKKHHKRSSSSSAIPSLDDDSSAEDRKWVNLQNRRSASVRKVSNVATEEEMLLLISAAQSLHVSGDNPMKARRYALKAVELLEKSSTSSDGGDVVSLHLLAATLCKLGQYEESIQVLQKSISISLSVRATFSGFMQLGDTYFMVGVYDAAMASYESALYVQKQVLGDSDLQVASTCIYLAEAYLQLMIFKEAEDMCNQALNIIIIHKEKKRINADSSHEEEEEVSARRLMALIHSAKGENEAALEQLLLAASASSSSSSMSNIEVANLDVSMGDTYLVLGRFDEAMSSYHKALAVFKLVYGEGHTTVASIYISLADLYLRRGIFKESKRHCEKALLIYGGSNKGGRYLDSIEEMAIGLCGVAGLFESMGELKHAISLLNNALEILEEKHQTTMIIGGVEAQLGVLLRMNGNHEEAYMMLRSAISVVGQGGSTLVVAMLLNQMGMACAGLNSIRVAADCFEQSRAIFQHLLGDNHFETLDVCLNLAGAYDAMGRVGDAISLLDNIVEVKEKILGTAHPDVEHAMQWLAEMLKETGQTRSRKNHTLHDLLCLPKPPAHAPNVPNSL